MLAQLMGFRGIGEGGTRDRARGCSQRQFESRDWRIYADFANRKPVINLFDLQTRKVRPVYMLEKPTPEWIGGMPVSKDGKFMLFPQVDQSSSDLMLIENWQ